MQPEGSPWAVFVRLNQKKDNLTFILLEMEAEYCMLTLSQEPMRVFI